MKVKLYHKFVEAARKHAMKRKIARKWLFRRKAYDNQFVCHPAKTITDDYRIVLDDDRLFVVSPASFLSFVWNGLLWKEIWRKKYARYSRKYWEPEACLKRMIKTGNCK